jgi:hypothetical protein
MNSIPKFEGKRRPPLDAIRAFCVWSCGGSPKEVQLCPAGPEAKHPCDLYPYRLGTIPPGASRSLLKAIKARCLDCKPDGSADCDAFRPYEIHPPCPFWPFRLGKNPNIGKVQREKLRAHGLEKGWQPGSQTWNGARINVGGEDEPQEGMAA